MARSRRDRRIVNWPFGQCLHSAARDVATPSLDDGGGQYRRTTALFDRVWIIRHLLPEEILPNSQQSVHSSTTLLLCVHLERLTKDGGEDAEKGGGGRQLHVRSVVIGYSYFQATYNVGEGCV